MVDAKLFQNMVDGIIDGISNHGFGIGDGLIHDEGSDDESDGEYVLRAFYYDGDTELEHIIRINVTVEVEEIRSDDDDDEE